MFLILSWVKTILILFYFTINGPRKNLKMKKLYFAFISFVLLFSCKQDGKSIKNAPVDSKQQEQSHFISQRQLQTENHKDLNVKTEKQWDSLNGYSHKKVKFESGKVHSSVRTFGWHIYSNGTAYRNYNFNMLWGLSYFSYLVEPKTGNYKSIHQWKTTALVDSAKTNGCKVFLSVSNFGNENNSVFLSNEKAQTTLIDSVTNLLAMRNADGVNIDFEEVSTESKESFMKFIRDISARLKKENPDYMVSVCLYAVDWNDIFDISSIDSYVDFYTLMGYDYYGSFSKTTGPVTPFKTSEKFGKGLQASVESYKSKGVSYDKLIVGLPYYGAEWETKSSEIGTVATKFNSHPPYREIKKFYIDEMKIPLQFDSNSESSYMVVKENETSYKQIFFEDEKSLALKYDWINENKIGGVGIWALGYDDGYSNLWNLLREKFSQSKTE